MEEISDKERILFSIINKLSATLCLERIGSNPDREDRFKTIGDSELVHFEPEYKYTPQKGDLVLCKTIPTFPFSVGFVDEVYSKSEMRIREIGTNNVCNVHNELFEVIKGMSKEILYDGDKRKLYVKVVKAFKKLDTVSHRCSGVDIYEENDKNMVSIKITKRWSSVTGEEPIYLKMEWSDKTTISEIVKNIKPLID